jgi:hypothetical protein
MKVLSLHYLPCIEWFQVFCTDDCIIDLHEHFVKQTYRNRTVILSANGKLSLTIPVRKEAHHTSIADMKIDNEVRWQHQHWQAIMSAYNSAPYFLYYQDQLKPLFEKPYTSLTEWNTDLLLVCLKIMKAEKVPAFTQQYAEPGEGDLRQLISPKVTSVQTYKPYLQVFSEKFAFEPNLSILDVLFNHGPRWREFIL